MTVTTRFLVTRWASSGPDGVVAVTDALSRRPSELGPVSLYAFQPADRRRLNPLTALALKTMEAAVDPLWRERIAEIPLVYASAEGDGDVLAKLLDAIGKRQPVSPTQFHNSVHNAAAGYWSIGLGSQAATSALCAGSDTFGVALGEAGMQACAFASPVAMVVAERSFPPLLARARPHRQTYSIAAWCEPLGRTAGWTCELQAGFAPDARNCRELAEALVDGAIANIDGAYHVRRLAATLVVEKTAT